MPTYSFKNSITGEEHSVFMRKFSEKDDYLKEHPELTQIILQAPALHSGNGLGVRKIDDGFKDLLNGMSKSKSLPGNTIKT